MPPRLVPLLESGIVERVVRPLLSGKEAQVYLVESEGRLCAAKVYKGATERTFRNRSRYTEGRSVRNSRDQRAMGKRSRHGRKRDEATWNAAEADMIYKLDAAGVRVPKPYAFVEGVLVMECIEGPNGGPAPRLAESTLEPEYANVVFEQLMREVVKMLCADVVHGDLSVFNVLIEDAGPVIIDFPQAVDAAANLNARAILLRDVANITAHFKRGRPARELRYGHEMWSLYERGELRPDTVLTGRFKLPAHEVNAERLMQEMREVQQEEAIATEETEFQFERPPQRARAPRRSVSPSKPAQSRGDKAKPANSKRAQSKPAKPGPQVIVKGRPPAREAALPRTEPAATTDGPPKRRRRRRRRRSGGGGGSGGGGNA